MREKTEELWGKILNCISERAAEREEYLEKERERGEYTSEEEMEIAWLKWQLEGLRGGWRSPKIE
jgi:hypothetical protein